MNAEPKTPEEFDALPVGGEFGQRTENGITVPVVPDVMTYYASPDTIVSRIDEFGGRWILGRYANGTWFKRRM